MNVREQYFISIHDQRRPLAPVTGSLGAVLEFKQNPEAPVLSLLTRLLSAIPFWCWCLAVVLRNVFAGDSTECLVDNYSFFFCPLQFGATPGGREKTQNIKLHFFSWKSNPTVLKDILLTLQKWIKMMSNTAFFKLCGKFLFLGVVVCSSIKYQYDCCCCCCC